MYKERFYIYLNLLLILHHLQVASYIEENKTFHYW